MNHQAKQTHEGFKFLAVALTATVVVGFVGWYNPQGNEPIIGALVSTGRLAFLIFLIPLFARPLRRLTKTALTMTLMRWRRNAGICYGAAQSVHLVIVLMMFSTLSNPPTETIMVIIGGLGLMARPFRIGPRDELGFLEGGIREKTIHRRTDSPSTTGSQRWHDGSRRLPQIQYL